MRINAVSFDEFLTHEEIKGLEDAVTKTDLITVVANNAGIPKAAAEKAINAATEAIVEAVATGDKVTLVGFGTFDASTRAGRQGVNPRTREVIKINASKAPRFKAGKAFKDRVNQ